MKRLLFLVLIAFGTPLLAQPVLNSVLKPNREKLYRNILNNTITQNLSIPLNDSSEENWQDAFWAMQLLEYKSPWVDNRVHLAFNQIQKQSTNFQRSLLELGYSQYPEKFYTQSRALMINTTDPKIFALSTAYLLQSTRGRAEHSFLQQQAVKWLSAEPENPVLLQLTELVRSIGTQRTVPSLETFFQPGYLPGRVLMISFQRKNRNYPGMVMVRDTSGKFIHNGNAYFHIPQLARSITNLPGFFRNGNTPEGIYRMDGFDVSKSTFIGPTRNIQLTMPFEYKATHFFIDTLLNDSTWQLEDYNMLLPGNFRAYQPIYENFYAGMAGRSEIIAHGTTVNPEYYNGKSFYPLTPTQGCLCTKEIWDEETGRLAWSDQEKLADAIVQAGGPHGYAIVINIDDKEEPVTIGDIMPFINIASGN